MFVIKVYMIKDLDKKSLFRNRTLQYVTTLPYLFPEKPVNVCEQLNIMFKDAFEHVIDVQ